jgi:hypothetical protein
MPTSLFVPARTILLRGVTATGALTGRHLHQLALRVGVAVDVPLGCLDRPVTC